MIWSLPEGICFLNLSVSYPMKRKQIFSRKPKVLNLPSCYKSFGLKKGNRFTTYKDFTQSIQISLYIGSVHEPSIHSYMIYSIRSQDLFMPFPRTIFRSFVYFTRHFINSAWIKLYFTLFFRINLLKQNRLQLRPTFPFLGLSCGAYFDMFSSIIFKSFRRHNNISLFRL